MIDEPTRSSPRGLVCVAHVQARGFPRTASGGPTTAANMGALAAALGLLLIALLGCGRPTARPSPAPPVAPSPTPPAAPAALAYPSLPAGASRDACRVAMRPGHEDECAQMGDLTRYVMALELDVEQSVLRGRERITLANHAATALEAVVLRLYSNLPPARQGARSDAGSAIGAARIDGQGVRFSYRAQNTAVELQLSSPLQPGQVATIELDFVVQLAASAHGLWRLASFYPMLAVHDETGWRQDVSPVADAVYSESAFYTVYLTVPSSMQVAASGVEVAAVQSAGALTMHTYCSGPLRDFALAASERFQVASRQVDGIAVSAYDATGRAAGERGLDQASQALAIYNRTFGDYPYASFAIVLVPSAEGGMEYPGLVFIGAAGGIDTEFLIAHEVAHQWWYGVVGNDVLREPWLDEALAHYSAAVYMGEAHGPEAARRALASSESAYARLVQQGLDAPVGQAVWEFTSDMQYVTVVYNKGAIFLDTLRREVGDEAFFAALREYCRRYRYGVATGAGFRGVAEEVSGRSLGELYEHWVGK